eukprot:12649163-Prorocentrum_lima.AAC.1
MGVMRGVAALDVAPKEERIAIDSGSAEHVCPEAWHDEVDRARATGTSRLQDVQGQIIREAGMRTVK